MSFLKKIFGRHAPDGSDGSKFRALMKSYFDQLPPPSSRNNNNRCFVVLASGLHFGFKGNLAMPTLSRYTVDTCLFELTCYALASADFCAFNKVPEKRGYIQDLMFSQLDSISSRSGFLPKEAAYRYANSRVSHYGRLRIEGSDVDAQYYWLKHALVYASSNSSLAENLDEISPRFGDAIEDFLLTKELMDWDRQRVVEMDSSLVEIQ
jgi:hypothetical protein